MYLWDVRISEGCLDVSEGQVRTGQVRNGQATTGQDGMGQVRTGQVRTGPVGAGHMGAGQIGLGQVRKGQVLLEVCLEGVWMMSRGYPGGVWMVFGGLVRTGQVKSGQVKTYCQKGKSGIVKSTLEILRHLSKML